MKKAYTMKIAGLTRNLPLFPVNDKITIAAFIVFGDVELTVHCAAELLKRAPEYDIMVTAEAKSIPLIHEMAKQSGNNEYVVARKGLKVYMKNPLEVSVNSITTQHEQKLFIGEKEINMLKDKKVLIIDDVISTGESLDAMKTLIKSAGGNISDCCAVLAEGDAANRDDIVFLEPLPLFFK